MLMRNDKWDGRYDLVLELQFKTDSLIQQAKDSLKFKQICNDEDIAKYLNGNPDFFEKGIVLHDLSKLLDITSELKRGHFLHDVYHGYPEHYYQYQVDCLDYCYSAYHFYNEGYDYYHGRKVVRNYSEMDINSIPFTEQKRIQQADEVMLRNFREAYINLIFFVEGFINSVGYDAYLKGLAKNNIDDENRLKGFTIRKENRKSYHQLRQKIEIIPFIINGTKVDCEIEPYQTYLKINVELRNTYVHSSPDKPKITFGFEDWKNKCDELIDGGCFQVMEAFWKTCYPAVHFPIVIFNTFYAASFKGRPSKMYAEPK